MSGNKLRYGLAAGLLIGAVGILAPLIYRAIAPPPETRTWSYGDASVLLSADRESILLPWQCVTVHWEVTKFQAISLKGIAREGTGSEVVCPDYLAAGILNAHHYTPLFSIDFLNGQHDEFPIPIEVIPFNITNWLQLALAAGLILAAGYLVKLPLVSPLSQDVARWLRVTQELTPAHIRLARWMAYGLAVLNGIFVAFTLSAIGRVTLWLALLHIVVALLLAAAVLNASAQRWLARVMLGRYMLLAPLIWFMVSVLILDVGTTKVKDELFWSGVQVWHATLFFWLGLFWLASYALRRFEFDAPRRFAWLSLISIVALVCVAGFLLPYVRWKYDWGVFHSDQIPPDTPPMLAAVADQNTDSIYSYVPPTRAFPWVWRSFGGIVHRPVVLMVSSQACRISDAFRFGYLTNSFLCSIQSAVVGLWFTNVAIYAVSMLIVYELIRSYVQDPRIAWMGAALATICVLNVWYISIPSTDYAEMLIAMANLWVLHHLLSEPHPSAQRVVLSGIIMGLMLLVKLNATYLIFGVLASIGLRRWRALLGVTLVPLAIWYLYTQLVQTFGIPYYIQEASGGYRVLAWLWQDFIHYTPYQMACSLASQVGNAANMTALLFGFFTIVGVFVMIANRRYPRTMAALGWTLFLSMAAFMWVFTIVYVSHVLGLIPFVYGAVALGVDSAQTTLRGRFSKHPRLGGALALAVWGLAVAHNLIQWVAWQNRHIMNYLS